MDSTLLQRLRSPLVADRDLATQALVRMGQNAKPALRAILQAEHDRSLVARAAFTLAGIRPAEQGALWSGSNLPNHRETVSGTVSQLLGWLYERHRIRATAGDIDRNQVVQLEGGRANGLADLDLLCHKPGASWTSVEDGMVQLSSFPEAQFPVCYGGPIRTRLTSTEALHVTDYRSIRHVVTLGLDVTAHAMLSPTGVPRISDLVACDERGFQYRFRAFPQAATAGSARARTGSLPSLARTRDILTRAIVEPPDCFSATTEITRGTQRLDWIRGQVHIVYTAAYLDVAIDDLSPGHRLTCDDGTEVRVDFNGDQKPDIAVAMQETTPLAFCWVMERAAS